MNTYRLSRPIRLSLNIRRSSTFANTRKIACIGRNYVAHIKELNNPIPSEPFFFLKPPSSITTDRVLIPRGIEAHHEIELGLVIGSTIKDSKDSEEVMDAIEGYFLAIDMTARNLQDHNKRMGLPWTTAKGFDTFCPVSRFIPRSEIPDPHDVELELLVNGSIRQKDSTNLMVYKISRILNHVSSIMTLERGDLVLTGTPKGVSRVVDGDTMEGRLLVNNRVVTSMTIPVADRVGGYSFQ